MKKILSIILLPLLVLTTSLFFVRATDDVTELVVHYYRYDDNYTGFNFWLWQNQPEGKGGNKFDFSNGKVDQYGAYVTIDLTKTFGDTIYGETTRFGIIVKQGDWDGYREPGGDRFFNVSDMEVIDGKYHVWIVQQDFHIATKQSELVGKFDPKILKADFTVNQNIDVGLTEKPTKVEVIVDDVIKKTVTPNSNNVTISDFGGVNLLDTYELKATFSDGSTHTRIVSIERLYDTALFSDAFNYTGELGAIYENNKTTFRLWAPISQDVKLNLYNQGHPDYDKNGNNNKELEPYETIDLTRINNGAWEVVINEDLDGKYYTFSVTNYGITQEVTDPYSYSTGANGLRSMVTNFADLNPNGWEYNSRPNNITNITDYIIYELQVRDLSSHSSWNGPEEHRAKFMAFTDSGTTYTSNDGVTVTTGLDHLDELGINAVHLLPIFDFGYVDEVQVAKNPFYAKSFNWGYMPYHFNTLEGSFSTNPFDGGVRINEFKQLVQSLHSRDIRVIMDVVYNHTGETETGNFHKILPAYYHRVVDGQFSNGSGTGNETASERFMVRKFMKDSVEFFAREYNISGFRFDLMALHDLQTMSEIEDLLYEIDPTIIVYGEPWTGGSTPLPGNQQAGKDNLKSPLLNNVGGFNDTTRDAIKGQGDGNNTGWIQGNFTNDNVNNIKYGIAGGVDHSQVSTYKWHLKPTKTINYISAHDNKTLHDKLLGTGLRGDELERALVQGNAIVLTSQGIPFLHAGVDFMRSKPLVDGTGYDHNSYESPDEVNQLRWDRKARYINVFEYYKALIHLRKTNPQFRIANADHIKSAVSFKNTNDNGVIHFEINYPGYPTIVVVHNANKAITYRATLPAGKVFNVHSNIVMGSNFPISSVSGTSTVLMSTTAIYIEQKSHQGISVVKDVVEVEKGTDYNLLNNINYDLITHKVYTNSSFNKDVPGKYLVSATIVDLNGNVIPLTYTLVVKGDGDKVTVVGG